MKGIKNVKQGFTLLELLVVVLIIGILASIALPQYQMAVTKAKVASMLPLMRRWKDALQEYKLQHGSYCIDSDCDEKPDGSMLGVNWPSDWKDLGGNPCGDDILCSNDYWSECFANEEENGEVHCTHYIDDENSFKIIMYQPDESNYEELRNKIVCLAYANEEVHKICKALGGKLIEDYGDNEASYQLY